MMQVGIAQQSRIYMHFSTLNVQVKCSAEIVLEM